MVEQQALAARLRLSAGGQGSGQKANLLRNEHQLQSS